MADQSSQNRRQELYDQIRASSKEEVILSEMKKMGFWPSDADNPTLPESFLQRERELNKELRELVQKQQKYQDQERMLAEIRRERMAESRRKQKETKERRKREREERAENWRLTKEKDIVYLGEDVSGGLQENTADAEKLRKNALPEFADVAYLAAAMNISVGRLRFLAYNRKVRTLSHYRRFYIPKKRGGKRLISAPMPYLKQAQHWILENILDKVPLHEAAHGFRQGRSIVSNARPHLAADLVVNIDLKDFFPTVTYKRVKGMFKGLGYSEKLATIFALICTEPDVDQVELDGREYQVASSERHLPQGAPTSPAISNIICRKLDARLQGLAKKFGYSYTRYADDMTFSGSKAVGKDLGALIGATCRLVKEEGFTVHPEKLRIMRAGMRKEVTGVVVNDKLSVSRKRLRNFRALIYQIEKDGIAGKSWEGAPRLLPAIHGFAAYVAMVDPERGGPLLQRVKAILEKYEPKKKRKKPQRLKGPSEDGPDGEKPWWQFW